MSKELPFAPHLQTETNNLLHHQNSSSFTALPMAQSACLRQDPKCQATESSFTEVSCPLDAPPVEFEAAAFEANDPVRWKLLELVREELKQLKATKAAYVSKKQVIRQLRSLLEHFDSLPTLMNTLKTFFLNTFLFLSGLDFLLQFFNFLNVLSSLNFIIDFLYNRIACTSFRLLHVPELVIAHKLVPSQDFSWDIKLPASSCSIFTEVAVRNSLNSDLVASDTGIKCPPIGSQKGKALLKKS
ncbi:unnamed protein product [Mesocestoides corti]|uniref:Rho_N domain-containing protein n=1 Tax=Mesocestoides corti TaxID=53468 RepID=A0A0R3UHL8_MESCO|nr:unnamed protein product [Mesocestoides corti]